VKRQEEKKKNARYALENIKPVARVTVAETIISGFGRNYNSVNRVKEKRQKYPENFDKYQERQMMNIGYVVFKNLLAAHHGQICVHVHEKINTERHDSRYLVQLSQEKSSADFYSHSWFSLRRILILDFGFC